MRDRGFDASSLHGSRLSPPHLRRPAVDALAAATNLQPLNLDSLHAGGIVQPWMAGHAAGVCPLLRHELQHRSQESGDALSLVLFEMVFLLEDIGQRPVSQSVNVPELALPVEYFLAPFAAEAERAREGAKQFDDLRNVVVVLAIFCARLWIEEVVARDQLKDLS